MRNGDEQQRQRYLCFHCAVSPFKIRLCGDIFASTRPKDAQRAGIRARINLDATFHAKPFIQIESECLKHNKKALQANGLNFALFYKRNQS